MAKATIEHETHFRKSRAKTENYSKNIDLVKINGKFKKGKIFVLRDKNNQK